MKKILFAGALLAALGSYAAAGEHVKVYHGESCGCCHNWAKYMEQNGFEVEMISLADEPLIQKKNELKLPLELASCHTAIIDGYVIEGHMPVGEIRTLLKNKPKDVIGIAFIGIAAALDIPLGLAAGAIIAGAYVSEIASPLTDRCAEL